MISPVGVTGSATLPPTPFTRSRRIRPRSRATFAAKAVAAGLGEREVRLAERQSELLAQTIRAILGDLGLTAEQWELVPAVVRRHLAAAASWQRWAPASLLVLQLRVAARLSPFRLALFWFPN